MRGETRSDLFALKEYVFGCGYTLSAFVGNTLSSLPDQIFSSSSIETDSLPNANSRSFVTTPTAFSTLPAYLDEECAGTIFERVARIFVESESKSVAERHFKRRKRHTAAAERRRGNRFARTEQAGNLVKHVLLAFRCGKPVFAIFRRNQADGMTCRLEFVRVDMLRVANRDRKRRPASVEHGSTSNVPDMESLPPIAAAP